MDRRRDGATVTPADDESLTTEAARLTKGLHRLACPLPPAGNTLPFAVEAGEKIPARLALS